MIGPIRDWLRNAYFGLWRQTLQSPRGQSIAADALHALRVARPELNNSASPYADLGAAPASSTARRADIVMVTARFRSGSTVFWNIFRQLPNCTAYYEPLNERRWFDDSQRGERVDPTHRQVADYWREYAGLGALGRYFQASWNERDLYMDAAFWDPNLQRYLELLIEHAAHRPVLKFNRADFRLPWLRANFPAAKIVHLYRHPRDQWMSTLVDPGAVPRELAPREFAAHDAYYLLNWSRDLKLHFPFLDEQTAEHPYQLFYYVWKLSYLFGRGHADYSLAYEQLLERPREELGQLLTFLDFPCESLDRLAELIERPRAGKWREYADDAWFQRHETVCEGVLEAFLAAQCHANNQAIAMSQPRA